jgi:hypothetical protein
VVVIAPLSVIRDVCVVTGTFSGVLAGICVTGTEDPGIEPSFVTWDLPGELSLCDWKRR